jgi:putative spermidine/putrescine transport system ATP-binding protein
VRSSAAASTPALRAHNLTVPFGDRPGLADVNFTVGAGERFAIVGSSGAGKTTLLRALAGLAPTMDGRIEIGGRDVTTLLPERRDAVYLHQTPVLFPHLSVYENVAFPLRVRRRARDEIAVRVREMLAAVRLETFADRAPRTLSGGQRHRVALARAMIARPAVLLLDEPLSSLDPALRDGVRDAILELQRAYQPGLVLVTHDFDEAGIVADRVAVLLDHRLAPASTPADLFARPSSLAIARFLGLPNEVPGVVLADGTFESALGRFRPRTAVTPGSAVAVCRADALRPAASGAPVHVVSIRHRAQRTSVIGDLGPNDKPVRVEFQVDVTAVPSMGAIVPVAVEPMSVSVFSSS